MPPKSVTSEENGTRPYESAFLRAARSFTYYRPHLNPCSGGDRFRRAKMDGERPLSYPDAVKLVMSARKEGAKHGVGAEMVAALVNAFIADTLANGAVADVEVRIVNADADAVASPKEEAYALHVEHSQLVTVVTEALEDDGVVDLGEARAIHRHHSAMEKRLSRFVRATLSASEPRRQVRA